MMVMLRGMDAMPQGQGRFKGSPERERERERGGERRGSDTEKERHCILQLNYLVMRKGDFIQLVSIHILIYKSTLSPALMRSTEDHHRYRYNNPPIHFCCANTGHKQFN